jgi:hypothetical protein
MKIASTVGRYLMGLTFTVIGLNGFLHFMPMAPMSPMAGRFIGVLAESHYLVPVFLLQIVCGLLFLANRYVPLALTLIGPVIVNILLFHLLMDPGGIAPGIVVTVCWFAVYRGFRAGFHAILHHDGSRREPEGDASLGFSRG